MYYVFFIIIINLFMDEYYMYFFLYSAMYNALAICTYFMPIKLYELNWEGERLLEKHFSNSSNTTLLLLKMLPYSGEF